MAVSTELEKLEQNIINAYSACEEKGATMPTNKNMDNLADTISTITGGGGVVPPEYGELVKLEFGYLPKLSYMQGEYLDIEHMSVSAVYESGAIVDITDVCTIVVGSPLTPADKSFTIQYGGKELVQAISVEGSPVAIPPSARGLWLFNENNSKEEIRGLGATTSSPYWGTPSGINSGYMVAGRWNNSRAMTTNSSVRLGYMNALNITEASNITIATFCIEWWGKCLNASYPYPIFSMVYSLLESNGILMSNNAVPFGATVDNKWHHYAIQFNNGVYRTYQDGVMLKEYTYYSRSQSAIHINISNGSGSGYAVDSVLISDGLVHWDSFAPPTGQWYVPSDFTLQ